MDCVMRVPVTAAVFAAMAVLLSGCMAYNAATVETGDGVSATASVSSAVMRTAPGHIATARNDR
jgi:PBP1b-binding outer membrane lipoprotein LpoB